MDDDRLYAREAAKLLRRDPQTLAQWRSHGRGPVFYRDGRRIFYLRRDIDAYLGAQMVPHQTSRT